MTIGSQDYNAIDMSNDGFTAMPILHIIQDVISANVTITGYATRIEPATSEAVFKIRRRFVNGVETIDEWASIKFDQIWDDRISLFSPVAPSDPASVIFGGIDESMVTDSPGVSGNAARTFSAWVKSTLVDKQGILSYGDDVDTRRINLLIIEAPERLVLNIRPAFVNFNVVGITDGQWHHVAVTMPAAGTVADIKGFFDGLPATINSTSGGATNYDTGTNIGVVVAKTISVTGQFFVGNIDEVSIWDTDLSATEIAEIYNSGTPDNLLAHSKAANLNNWWQMGEDAVFPTIEDIGPDNQKGILVNMESGDIVSDTPP